MTNNPAFESGSTIKKDEELAKCASQKAGLFKVNTVNGIHWTFDKAEWVKGLIKSDIKLDGGTYDITVYNLKAGE